MVFCTFRKTKSCALSDSLVRQLLLTETTSFCVVSVVALYPVVESHDRHVFVLAISGIAS